MDHAFAVPRDFRRGAEGVGHGVVHDAFDAGFLVVEVGEFLELGPVVGVFGGVVVDEVAPAGLRGTSDDGLGENLIELRSARPSSSRPVLRFRCVLDGPERRGS